ncbi:hypothetical protein, partial [Pseudomonas poae]|uniref:hypothetical protein n=1 Tax=Pseudomonas poae TaxID=200451 RepID=UPI0034D4E634
LVADKDQCFLLEAAYNNKIDREFQYKLTEITDDYVCRTNHGILLKNAGYKESGSKEEIKKRKSSESRLKIVEEKMKSIN